MFDKPPITKDNQNSIESKESSFNLDRSRKYLKKLALMGMTSLTLLGTISNCDFASADQIEQQLEQLKEVKQVSMDELMEKGFEGPFTENRMSGDTLEHRRGLKIHHSFISLWRLKKDEIDDIRSGKVYQGYLPDYKEELKAIYDESQGLPSLEEHFKANGLSSLYDYLAERMDIYQVSSVGIADGEIIISRYDETNSDDIDIEKTHE